MKRICLDARMIEHSGIGTYLRNLIPLVTKGSFEWTLIVSRLSLKTFPWLSSYSLIFCEDPIYSIGEQLHLLRLIPSCDLFWSPHFNIPLLPTRAKKRLVTIHDLYHLAFFSTLKWKEKLYAKLVLSQAMQRADWVITDSYFTLTEMQKFFPEKSKKVSVIHCGVESLQYLQMDDDQEIVKRYALPPKYFLFVGNLKTHKNLEGLFRAFELLVKEKKRISLVIVGKGSDERFQGLLERFPQIRDQILWLKNVENQDLPAIYRRALALVFPSFYEGFGLPPLEAMASSCPVIASHVASIPEICEDAALYVDPHDPLTIKEKMALILEDESLKNRLVEAGEKRILQFSWGKAAHQHLTIIKDLLCEESSCS